MSASGSDGVPSVRETFRIADAEGGTIEEFLGFVSGGIVGGIAFGVTAIIRAIGAGVAGVIAEFLEALGGFLSAFPAGSETILTLSAQASAAAAAENGIIAFWLGIILVFGAVFAFFLIIDITERPVPFVPFLGGDD
jgi:hypothetical protein